MKAVHINKTDALVFNSFAELIAAAKEEEKAGDLKTAENLYRQGIKMCPANELSYHRLMILLRKQKQYNRENTLIKSAISSFEKLHNPTKVGNKKVTALSSSIIKITGLADKKGKHVFDHQPVKKWKKRLELLQKYIR